MTMTISKACLEIALLGLAIAACGGRVQGPGSSGSPGGGAEAADDAGEAPDAVRADAGWDGWSGNSASGASGAAPACQEQPVPCGQLFPGATPFASSQDAADAIVGRWVFCKQSDFYPPEQIGEEYAADGTYYELVAGPGGQPARNMNPDAISRWQVDVAPNGAIEVHTFDGGMQVGGGLSACPASLELVVPEQRVP